jgi:hypothetical protein
MTRCGGTVTGTRARYKCFLRQLQSNSIIVHMTLRELFPPPDIVSITDRAEITRILNEIDLFPRFQNRLFHKSPKLAQIIMETLKPYLELIGLDETETLVEPILALWHFMTRLIYERPCLLQADTIHGDHVMFIHSTWKSFISEQVSLPLI